MKTVVLLSGGLDSTTLLYDRMRGGDEVFPISFDYGQRHKRELLQAEKILSGLVSSEGLRTPWRVVDLHTLAYMLKGSSQTDPSIEVPEGHYASESMKLTVVPNRNMIMLAIACAYAITMKAETIAFAAHAGDHAIYPDCRPQFVYRMDDVFQVCHFYPLNLRAPFLYFSKAEIVRHGRNLNVPFELTWSCYKGNEIHCGKCGTCVERKEAFVESGITDPTIYE
jgi:7-cyano-7-deazaguanine synthase